MIYTIARIYDGSVSTEITDKRGLKRWVYAVPVCATFGRFRAAWAVLTGKAVALRWPEPGELEDALAWQQRSGHGRL